ncbi:cation:H+ antiporter [Prosthecobacter debontii]|uniref:Cation:H+ antiporter n=1 Tax=Prosthecobacter debontii TaxID=48467 RepID=A0A1T4XJH0_9BACT|nr:sodium:proton exchanger [Prosthecobacter debontii]SKA89308.1 cation:H+ antiporter [Prosthecobacter debontii]
MFESLALPWLVSMFAASAVCVWVAGIHLSRATDVLSVRWGMGEALGGMILLAIVTNLPEIAIVASGAARGEISVAVGNILGGIAIQTVVLVILDIALGKSGPLTHRAASLSLVLEAALVIAVLSVTVIGSQLPDTLIGCRVTPQGLLIAVLWMVGLGIIGRSRGSLPWQLKLGPEDLKAAADSRAEGSAEKLSTASISRSVAIFVVGAVITLICGVLLESTGDAIATHIGMDGILFGATVLAAATSLPEVSTGLASIKLKDDEMAVSDIFGGNAFLPVLFLLGTLISGQAILPHADKFDLYLTGLGMLLTTVYLVGLIFRSPKRIAGMGRDSLLVLVLYVIGMVGLLCMA